MPDGSGDFGPALGLFAAALEGGWEFGSWLGSQLSGSSGSAMPGSTWAPLADAGANLGNELQQAENFGGSPAPTWSPSTGDVPDTGGSPSPTWSQAGNPSGSFGGSMAPTWSPPPPPPQDCYAGPAATCTPPAAPESLLGKQWITRTINLPNIRELFKEGRAFEEGVRSPSSSGTRGAKEVAGENGTTSNSSETDLTQYLHSLLYDFQPSTPTVSDPAAGTGSTVSSSGPASGNTPSAPVPGPQIPQAERSGTASAINSGITENEATPATATGGANIGGGSLPATGIGACQPDPGNGAGGPSYNKLVSQGAKDAHHIIQHAAVRDLPGYSRGLAPAIQLAGPSTLAGSAHYAATAVQRLAGGGTYGRARDRV